MNSIRWNQGEHTSGKDKRRAEGPRGSNPLKMPLGDVDPVRVCGARNCFPAVLVGVKGLEEEIPPRSSRHDYQ